jgi:hypothetical protein
MGARRSGDGACQGAEQTMITDAADRAVPDLDIDAFSEAFLTG